MCRFGTVPSIVIMALYEGVLDAIRPLVSPLFISDGCFDSLLVHWNHRDIECLKQTISKVAGYGIIALASILKLPLIINIVKAGSTVGLATSSIYLEISMYASNLVYNIFIESPISTYGELYVILAQNLFISMLIWKFNSKSIMFCLGSVIGFVLMVLGFLALPKEYWPSLMLYSTVCACASRLPQIITNFQNGHTGVLSLITLLLGVAGAFVRLLTLLQEVNDIFAVVGTLLPLVLNSIILLQIIYYHARTKAHFINNKKNQ